MKPALHIPLTDEQLKMIGEICAILGQIEMFMEHTVWWLLNVSPQVAARILGSTDMRAKSDVWASIFRTKCLDRNLVGAAEKAIKDLAKLAEGRNDFVHAFFATHVVRESGNVTVGGIYIGAGPDPNKGTPVAIRTRNRKQRAASSISVVRDEAARLSHVFLALEKGAYTQWDREHRAEPHASRGISPQRPLPHSTKAVQKRAKAHQPPPRS